jgi:NAD(P)H-dependent FMN reductase
MNKINLVIISGSHRKNSESGKVARFIQQTIQTHTLLSKEFEPSIVNLADEDLPFYEDRSTSSDPRFATVWDPCAEKLAAADAFVIVSPEWNGMVPAKLKNVFLLANKEFYHKPALIVAVSSSMGGHYVVAELRMSSYKNSRICYLPDHLIIRNVVDFNQNPHDSKFTEVCERLENYLKTLFLYAQGLKNVRQSVLDAESTKKYPHGM